MVVDAWSASSSRINSNNIALEIFSSPTPRMLSSALNPLFCEAALQTSTLWGSSFATDSELRTAGAFPVQASVTAHPPEAPSIKPMPMDGLPQFENGHLPRHLVPQCAAESGVEPPSDACATIAKPNPKAP